MTITQMTKITEPKSLTRKQFEHTIWFLHHLHTHNLIDHPLLITLLQHAGATYGAGATCGFPPHPPSLTEQGQPTVEGTYGSLPNPPLSDTKPKRVYKKRQGQPTVEGQPTVSPCLTAERSDAPKAQDPLPFPETKPKRTYKKRQGQPTELGQEGTVGSLPLTAERSDATKAQDPLPLSDTKPKRVYKKKVVSGDVQQDKPERKGVCSINDLIKNVLLQGDCRPPCDPPAQNIQQNAQVECLAAADGNLCEEPLIIVHPCAGGGYIDSGNNIHHF